MNKILFLILSIFSVEALCFENLQPSDFYGHWESVETLIKAENHILIIRPDNSAVFVREFGKPSKSKVHTMNVGVDSLMLIKDILILEFDKSDTVFTYKLVLSGTKSKYNSRIYGMLYMYNNGKKFNGIPISLAKSNN